VSPAAVITQLESAFAFLSSTFAMATESTSPENAPELAPHVALLQASASLARELGFYGEPTLRMSCLRTREAASLLFRPRVTWLYFL
jgi:hypothetical protein